MPPEIKVNRQDMIDKIIEIIERSGFSAVSARTLADALGISTQPIYREFGDMNGVREAAVARGFEMFGKYVSGEAVDQSVKYVMFAVDHGNLFKFLFCGNHCEYGGLDDISHKLLESTDIIDRLQAITELPREKVYRLHLSLWMALHGLSLLAADNKTAVKESEIKEWVKEMTAALTTHYKSEV